MKKFKLLVFLLSGILLVNSCDTKDLDLTSPNGLSPDTYFTTAEQVQAAVNGAYINLQTQGLYTRHIFFALDNMSGENTGNTQLEGNKVPFLKFTFDSSSDIIETIWGSCYSGVNKSNFVINNQDKINAIPEGLLSTEKKNKFIAEARFMRAYYYFLLVNRFGDIPLYEESTITPKPRSPKADVFALIEADLDFASKNLLSKTTEDKGRATKEAAFAYLGKVLLYQKKYDAALTAFAGVTGFSLETDYYNNFTEEGEHGVESIFEVEYDEKLGTGSIWNFGAISGQGANEATFRAQEYGRLNWNNVHPSVYLTTEYENGDLRFKGTVYRNGDKYNNGLNTFGQTKNAAGDIIDDITTNGEWKKYQNYYKKPSETGNISSINFKVMRYADVLLMRAECMAFKPTADIPGAVTLLNLVRTRAGLADVNPTTPAAFTTALIHERKVELAGEQLHFDDVVRWGKGVELFGGRGFLAGKHEVWPIPNREMSSNPNITAADQNPGY